MERKYTALRFIATMMKVFGMIVAGLTALAVLGICGTGLLGGAALDRMGRDFGQSTGGLGAFTGLVGGLIATILPIILGGSLALVLYAAGEAVNLQIDIEVNTRTMAWYLQQQARLPSPASVAVQQPQPILADSNLGSDQISTMKNYCPQCGAKLDASDESCPQCNYDLN